MKLSCLRAQALMVFKAALAVVALGLSAAFPAGAQDSQLQPTLVELIKPVKVDGISCRYLLDGPLPSASSTANFSPWTRMHPHTFDGKIGSFTAQCRATVGSPPWLTHEVCDQFGKALAQGNCAVVPDVNNIRLDVVRGKRNGHSVPFLNEHMRLQEPRQAVFVSLPGNLWLGMFAGEPGQSCNNFFALRDEPPPPPPIPVEVVSAPPPPPQGKWVCVNVPIGETVSSPFGHQLEGFVVRDNCCCGNDLVVRSHNFNLGSTLQSEGYAEKCFWIEPNQP